MSHVIPFFAAAGPEKGSKQSVRLTADPRSPPSPARTSPRQREERGQIPLSLNSAVQKRIGYADEAWLPRSCPAKRQNASKPAPTRQEKKSAPDKSAPQLVDLRIPFKVRAANRQSAKSALYG
jgi:hypothetical protein